MQKTCFVNVTFKTAMCVENVYNLTKKSEGEDLGKCGRKTGKKNEGT